MDIEGKDINKGEFLVRTSDTQLQLVHPTCAKQNGSSVSVSPAALSDTSTPEKALHGQSMQTPVSYNATSKHHDMLKDEWPG